MRIKKGMKIVAYGQVATISNYETLQDNTLIHLNHSIVVPHAIYTRDYIFMHEIQKILQ